MAVEANDLVLPHCWFVESNHMLAHSSHCTLCTKNVDSAIDGTSAGRPLEQPSHSRYLGRVYQFVTHPYMKYFVIIVATEWADRFQVSGAIFQIVGALHFWRVVAILKVSIQARRLVLHKPAHNSSKPTVVPSATVTLNHNEYRAARRWLGCESLIASWRAQLSSPLRALYEPLVRMWQFAFGRRGVFGVENDLFPAFHITRELIEIVSQTFQAHRCGKLIARPWVNNLSIFLLVANAWSTPLLQHLLGQRHPILERVVCLIVDATLNIGSSMCIPLVLFMPYYLEFNPETYSFGTTLLYDTTWFSSFVMENQLVFAVSLADFVSKLIPYLSVLNTLATAASLLQPTKPRRPLASAASQVQPVSVLSPLPQEDPRPTSLRFASRGKTAIVRSTRHRGIQATFVVWGLVVLIFHLLAVMRSRAQFSGCKLSTRPWFGSKLPCSVLVYNCYREETQSLTGADLEVLDHSTLAFVTFAHYPRLIVPSKIQSFSNLLGMHIHNSTIVEWSAESALTASKFARIILLLFTRVNMSALPEGILQTLPPSLVDIEFSHTNLTALPSDLHKVWQPMAVFFFEFGQLTEFPETLLRLPVMTLSLRGNLITDLPQFEALNQPILFFAISDNPLTSLPDVLGDKSFFSTFTAENTWLRDLPAWASESVTDAMFLRGTPYCAAKGDAGNGEFICAAPNSRDGTHISVELYDLYAPL